MRLQMGYVFHVIEVLYFLFMKLNALKLAILHHTVVNGAGTFSPWQRRRRRRRRPIWFDIGLACWLLLADAGWTWSEKDWDWRLCDCRRLQRKKMLTERQKPVRLNGWNVSKGENLGACFWSFASFFFDRDVFVTDGLDVAQVAWDKLLNRNL